MSIRTDPPSSVAFKNVNIYDTVWHFGGGREELKSVNTNAGQVSSIFSVFATLSC
jgi:hypothetical protein